MILPKIEVIIYLYIQVELSYNLNETKEKRLKTRTTSLTKIKVCRCEVTLGIITVRFNVGKTMKTQKYYLKGARKQQVRLWTNRM